MSFPAGMKVLPTAAMVPTFISILGKFSRVKRVRFICSHRQIDEVDMSIYRDKFAQRMAMAGLKPHHRLAIAVSGGPDSVALCILTAWWKSGSFITSESARSNPLSGILAIVVDHGLRTESTEEADLVSSRIMDMGIKCEVARCEWLEGRPKVGHLQEAARNKRLSRNSGVLGLAGMAFIAETFAAYPDLSGEGSKTHGILLVRPLLEFSKEDLYNICRGVGQEWVEDPTNRSPVFARNRIRLSLKNFSSCSAMAELREVISTCREIRLHVEKYCRLLLNQIATIMPHGYAVLDLEKLLSMEFEDIYLARVITLVLQFVSQKHRPVRGKALKLLLSYFRTYPCKLCLMASGCYLCPAPESKGTRVIISCSVDSSLPPTLELFNPDAYAAKSFLDANELEQIVLESEAHLDRHTPDASSVLFFNSASSDSVLEEFERLRILSPSTYQRIVSLKNEEGENFKSKGESMPDIASEDDMESSSLVRNRILSPGQAGYFMNRFVLHWTPGPSEFPDTYCCSSCPLDGQTGVEVRHMIDADWIHVFDLAKEIASDSVLISRVIERTDKEALLGATKYAVLSAKRALPSLKSIPAPARRAIPVLVNTKGVLLSIPGVAFAQCPCFTMIKAVFKPRVPLGGGHSSFL